MMKKNIKKVTILLMLLFIASMIVGCGNNSVDNNQQTAGNGEEQEVVDDYVVQAAFFNCDMMTPCPISYYGGLYEKHGVNAEITMTSQVGVMMAAGQIDVGYMGTNAVNNALLQGTPMKMVALNHLGGSYYVVGSNELKEPKDLVGKRISMDEDEHDTNPEWRIMAHNAGIPYDPAEYEIFSMSQKDAYFALKIGELDAIMCCDPWCSLAEYEGVGQELMVSTKLPDGDWGYKTALMMTDSFLEEHPELAKRILKAHVEAIKLMYTNPVPAGKIFAEAYDVPEEVGLFTVYRKTVGEGRTMFWEIDESNIARYNKIAKEFFNMKYWQESVPPEEFTDESWLAELDLEDFDTFIKEEVDPVFPVGMSFEEWKEKAFELYEQ